MSYLGLMILISVPCQTTKISPSPTELIAGRMILAASPGTVEPELSERMCMIIKIIAIQEEILDTREANYYLSINLQNDLDMLRRRLQDLEDAPKLSYIYIFPMNREEIAELKKLNRTHRSYLAERFSWEIDRQDILGAAIDETDMLWKAWDKLGDAKCDFYYVCVRRQALKDLRDRIGTENFRRGTMPDCVPFRE